MTCDKCANAINETGCSAYHSADCETNADRHYAILDILAETYRRKNADYGDSFHDTIARYGLVAGMIRIEDKVARARTLIGKHDRQVQDESLRDTLLDLANYAIMVAMEL